MNLIASVDIDLASFTNNELPVKKNFRTVQAKIESLWTKVNQSPILAQFALEKIGNCNYSLSNRTFYVNIVFQD